jgi:hypothetical protein
LLGFHGSIAPPVLAQKKSPRKWAYRSFIESLRQVAVLRNRTKVQEIVFDSRWRLAGWLRKSR